MPRICLLLALFACVSCDFHRDKVAATQPTTKPIPLAPTVASLVPAATDLIVGMGAGAHLVAVSTYDTAAEYLPRVGNYEATDWEKLSELRPSLLIVQMEESRLPQGFRDHAQALNVKLVNIQIERLDDIYRTLDQLGQTLNESAKAAAAHGQLQSRLDAVHHRVSGETPVRTLVSLSDNGVFAAGPGTFLDDLLTIAGGTNVLKGTSQHWPQLDQERLIASNPQAVIQLLPGAPEQVQQRAAAFWNALPRLLAVAEGRVYVVTDLWALTPGIHVADLAERMADALHHPSTTQAIP